MSNVAINIAAEFIGKKAFKQAETSTDKLSRSVRKLAGSLGVAFGVRGIGAYFVGLGLGTVGAGCLLSRLG